MNVSRNGFTKHFASHCINYLPFLPDSACLEHDQTMCQRHLSLKYQSLSSKTDLYDERWQEMYVKFITHSFIVHSVKASNVHRIQCPFALCSISDWRTLTINRGHLCGINNFIFFFYQETFDHLSEHLTSTSIGIINYKIYLTNLKNLGHLMFLLLHRQTVFQLCSQWLIDIISTGSTAIFSTRRKMLLICISKLTFVKDTVMFL